MTAPWMIVARREIVAKLTDRTFLIGTLFSLLIIVAIVGMQIVLSERTHHYTVVAQAADAPMAEAVAAGAQQADDKVTVTVSQVASPADAEAAVRSGDANAWLHQGGADGGWVLTGREEVDPALSQIATLVVRGAVTAANAQAAGADLRAIERGSTLETALLVGDAQKQDLARAMGFVLAMLFYMSSLAFGFIIAGSVVEEKASRLVEILTTRISIRDLLLGKVLGNTALALAQMATYLGVGLVGLSFTSMSDLLPSVSAGVGWFLAFYVVGFVLLACLFAAAGSLATRSEDLQASSMPLTIALMAVFFSAFLAKGSVLVWLSFVPPFSGVLMPIRLLQGTAATWEPVVALALLLATSGLVIAAAARLYRRALLQTGGRLSLRQAWRLAS